MKLNSLNDWEFIKRIDLSQIKDGAYEHGFTNSKEQVFPTFGTSVIGDVYFNPVVSTHVLDQFAVKRDCIFMVNDHLESGIVAVKKRYSRAYAGIFSHDEAFFTVERVSDEEQGVMPGDMVVIKPDAYFLFMYRDKKGKVTKKYHIDYESIVLFIRNNGEGEEIYPGAGFCFVREGQDGVFYESAETTLETEDGMFQVIARDKLIAIRD